MDNESYFVFVFWHMQLYRSWYIRSFFGFTFLNILYFFKYSCSNIFHRRSLYTFYWNWAVVRGHCRHIAYVTFTRTCWVCICSDIELKQPQSVKDWPIPPCSVSKHTWCNGYQLHSDTRTIAPGSAAAYRLATHVRQCPNEYIPDVPHATHIQIYVHRQTSKMMRIKFQKRFSSRPIVVLPIPLKPGVKSKMKM